MITLAVKTLEEALLLPEDTFSPVAGKETVPLLKARGRKGLRKADIRPAGKPCRRIFCVPAFGRPAFGKAVGKKIKDLYPACHTFGNGRSKSWPCPVYRRFSKGRGRTSFCRPYTGKIRADYLPCLFRRIFLYPPQLRRCFRRRYRLCDIIQHRLKERVFIWLLHF